MKVEHEIYFKDNLIKSFYNSNWYDIATPYGWCLKELKEVHNIIKAHKELKIISQGKTYNIKNTNDFIIWIRDVFGGGFENDI